VKSSKPGASRNALERDRERGTRGRARECSTASESTMICGGVCGSGGEIHRPGGSLGGGKGRGDRGESGLWRGRVAGVVAGSGEWGEWAGRGPVLVGK
jgi:hypothetical protein